MNFYKHYIGDFQRDTSHLSMTERGAYLALIHHYYATELPLPSDYAALCRIAGAFTKPERDAVKVVMAFFTVVDSGLMHNRIEAELHKAGEISTTNRDIAVAREARRRAEKEAHQQHEACTKRDTNVPRIEHEQSTPQTPDTRLNTSSSEAGLPDCPHEDLIDLYSKCLPMLAQPRKSLWRKGKNAPALRARWRWVMTESHETGEKAGQRLATTREEGLAWFERFFNFVGGSNFLTGVSSAWSCDLGWLVKAENFEKVLQGNYTNKENA
ncbi:MAG: YdaU family protein [Polaromonas sp.]|nr:YdaU family protein [Polaromonas sp.]